MSEVTELPIAGYCAGDKPNEIILPAKPEPLAFDVTETALIVVDMQNAYASKNGYLDKAGFDISSTG
ncbi:MAG: pyrimidine utilization protein B, partial [Paraglaciecola sp.]